MSETQPAPRSSSVVEAFRQSLCETLEAAFAKLENCLGQLDDDQIWWRPDDRLNSIANLVLHMCGNLRQWSTVPLMDLCDDRDRESEFSARDGWTAQGLLRHCRVTIDDALAAIAGLNDAQALRRCNIQRFDVDLVQALVHTVSHFVGHTHQIILLTRMILKVRYRFDWDPDGPRDRVPL